ncbi:MAG: helix-turn-helix domain-containing protein, partial [Solirubrobacteraceae bacterium]
MENEEWDLLPGDVYAKSFLRTYGDFLGVDTRQLLDDYKRRYDHPSDQELRPIAPPGRERDRRPRGGARVPPWAVIGVVLVAVVAALYFVGKGNKSSPPAPTSATVGTTHKRHRGHRTAVAQVPPKPHNVKLQLEATGPVYVCLVDGSGRKLIPGQIFNIGQKIPTETADKLLLTLGNAAVKVKVNGANVKVAPSSSSIGYEFVPTGHSILSASQQPHCA